MRSICVTLVALASCTAVLAAPVGVVTAQQATPTPMERPSDPGGDDDIPDDTIDQTGDDEDDDDEPDPGESAFDSFDDITVERVQPDEVPDFKPGLPEGPTSRMDTSDLPESVSGQRLREVSAHVASSTVEIIAVTTPPQPYRATDMIYRGHALWLSPHESGEEPRLVATADWLEGADQIYAIDGTVGRALSDGGLEIGANDPQPIDDFTADTTDLLERYGDHLVPLQVEEANRHVNLARLTGADDVQIAAPEQGLVLHDVDAVMPAAIFGFSPSTGSSVVPVGYEDSANLELEYSFYFLVNFQAILGAPIVGSNGRLIGITALRHPSEPEHTLAIPPGAIHAFLDTGRATGSDDDDES